MSQILDNIEQDEEGFLLRPEDWCENVAVALAQRDAVTLTEEHWLLIQLARDYYNRYHVAPGMRILITLLRKHHAAESVSDGQSAPSNPETDTHTQQQRTRKPSGNHLSSRYLYRLFSDSPGRQVCCYAGLPKPVSCI